METVTDTLLEEITRRLVDELRPVQIILFGSQAWGVPDEGSDVDLLVIVDDGECRPGELAIRARRALRGMNISKDVLVKTRAEVERARKVYASLEAEVLERGKVLYG